MSESAILFPEIRSYTGMSRSMDDATLFPQLRSSIDDSAILDPEIKSHTGMDSRLYMAAEEGDVIALNNLIQEINIFQQFTGLGNSVLHIAISCGEGQFVRRVLEEVNRNLVAGREFVRAKNSDGISALHLAASRGYLWVVQTFVFVMKEDVEGGDDFFRSQNREGNSALHQTAKGTHYGGTWSKGKYYESSHLKGIEIVHEVLKHNDDLINMQNNEGETALFVASEQGHIWIVEELLLHIEASNSNMKRRDGRTPLHSAVLNGHTDVVQKLLQHSPELAKETDNCGRAAMHMLPLSFPVAGFLGVFQRRGRNTAEIVAQLVAKDNSLCYKEDNNKQTPIQLALEWERYDLVNNLLLCGRDCVEAVHKDGRKPLHLAVLNTTRLARTAYFTEVYEFKVMLLSLISKESVNHRDNTGRTPLHLAVENFEKDPTLYESIINVLQKHGAQKTPDILKLMRRVGQSPAKAWYKAENISINSVLIATVSFAAAFTLPGGLDSEHRAILLNTFLFKLFVICDTFSFCASTASAIIIQFAEEGGQQDRPKVFWSLRLMSVALGSLLVAFGAAINMVITPSPWLAGTVWVMACFVPLSISFAYVRS